MARNRKKATELLLTLIEPIDKHTDADNVGRYKRQLNALSDTQFHNFMKAIKEEKACFYLYMPNMGKHPSTNHVLAACKKLGVVNYHFIDIYDDVTGETMRTPQKHLVIRVPARRLQQYGDHKLAVPEGDRRVDIMTGQVIHEDRAAGLTNPELQSLAAKDLPLLAKELVTYRGGSPEAWQTGFKQQAEETGVIQLDQIDPEFKNRTSKTMQLLLEGMHFETNVVG